MDMRIFQVKTNKALPAMGSILIASPLLSDYHFARTVILMVTHNEEGSMGIVMNQMFHHDITLNELIPGLDSVPGIPVFKGGAYRQGHHLFHSYDQCARRRAETQQ